MARRLVSLGRTPCKSTNNEVSSKSVFLGTIRWGSRVQRNELTIAFYKMYSLTAHAQRCKHCQGQIRRSVGS